MKRLFNKTFFKFAGGFVGIVAVAMLSIFILGAYQMENNNVTGDEKPVVD